MGAWPITDEIWATWDEDPEHWHPIDHSCDPSAWLDDLDVVARRPIQPDGPITLAYGTFYNEVSPDFPCRCGTTDCRGMIRGTDYLGPFIERYGDHVSDYVRRARREKAGAGARRPRP